MTRMNNIAKRLRSQDLLLVMFRAQWPSRQRPKPPPPPAPQWSHIFPEKLILIHDPRRIEIRSASCHHQQNTVPCRYTIVRSPLRGLNWESFLHRSFFSCGKRSFAKLFSASPLLANTNFTLTYHSFSPLSPLLIHNQSRWRPKAGRERERTLRRALPMPETRERAERG